MEVLEYQTAYGLKPYPEWLRGLKDYKGADIIRKRITRLRLELFGDHSYVANGVWELRIFYGPGYRVYYLLDGENLVILLAGGDKDSQVRDIEKAKSYSLDYWRRK